MIFTKQKVYKRTGNEGSRVNFLFDLITDHIQDSRLRNELLWKIPTKTNTNKMTNLGL